MCCFWEIIKRSNERNYCPTAFSILIKDKRENTEKGQDEWIYRKYGSNSFIFAFNHLDLIYGECF